MKFTAAKSRLGHGETGAGILGVLSAVSRLGQYHCSQLTHLRTINPHVESVLAARRGDGLPGVLLPRSQAAGVEGLADWHMGVSAFAFQVCSST